MKDPLKGNPSLSIQWYVAGILATLVITLSLPLYLWVQSGKELPPSSNGLTFVGNKKCKECHMPEYEKWKNSFHDMAMDPATSETVLGDFKNAEFRSGSNITRFFKKKDRYFVHTKGPEGDLEEFEVTHVFGIWPLQQYLIPFPGNRLQCLTIAWDVEKKQWYALPNHTDDHTDWLHWTKAAQNWNSMCAECHLTNLKKEYDYTTDSFNTTWSEMDVSCEACHGPGSAHVDWASLPTLARGNDSDPHLPVKTRNLDAEALINICFRCHSRRGSIDDYSYQHGHNMDYLVPSLLTRGLYFPDGQILDEVYVMGSFTQSKMYMRGVKCNDCHDVHSLKLKQDGNDLCLTCHKAASYDTEGHHFHKKIYKGKESPGDDCVECHMPQRAYMGIDNRADHSIRIPRPDLSVKLDIPNACNSIACHGDKTAEWSAKYMKEWYGKKKRSHWAEILAGGQNGAPESLSDIIRLSKDSLSPVIVRATALSLLRNYSNPEILTTLEHALMDSDPLIRHTAISVMNQLNFPKKVELIFPLLYDPVRTVRIQAALGVALLKNLNLTPDQKRKLKAGIDEYISAMTYSSDFPSGRYNLGLIYSALGDTDQAIEAYKAAINLDNHFIPAKNNLAMLYNQTGQNELAGELLKQILQDQPELYEVSYSLGLLLSEQKQYEDAALYLKKAAGGMPERARVHYNLGKLLAFLKETNSAEASLLKALSLEPQNFDYLWALADFYIKSNQPVKALETAELIIGYYPDQKVGHEIKNFILERIKPIEVL